MVDEWIYKTLSGTTAITAVVDDEIYPIIRQEEGALPAIVYDILGIEPIDTKGIAATVDIWDCEITAFTETYSSGRTLIELVRTALDRQSGTEGTTVVDDCWVESYSQDKIDKTEIFTFSYTFKIRTKR